jgi:hypothetical protein
MKRPFLIFAVAAFAGSPLLAVAQPAPGPDAGAMGPPPAVRAKLASISAQAKTDGYAALSPAHRTAVEAIVAKVTAGSLDPHSAGEQIDALLTPDESQAVLAVAMKSRQQMRVAFAGSAPPPPDGGPPPNAGPPPAAGEPPPGGPPGAHERHRPTAGGFLMRVSLTPEQMHALRGDRPPAGPAPAAAAKPSP